MLFNKPSLKKVLSPYINEEKTGIRFGGHQINIARDIETDSPNKLIEILKLLNGENTIEEISGIMEIEKENLLEVINILYESGVIYEDDYSKYDFSSEEIKLYDRNLNFFKWIDVDNKYYNYWELQFKLKKSRVLLLGAGGTGSICAKNLSRLGIGNIIVVDSDIVDISNLNRQEYDYADIGKKKIEALKNLIKRINPFTNIEIIDEFIDSKDIIIKIIKKYNPDIIISCIDEPVNINEILSEVLKIQNIPWIMGGYASTIMKNCIFLPNNITYKEIINKNDNITYDTINLKKNYNLWNTKSSIISPISNLSGSLSSLYAFYYLSELVEIESSKIIHLDFFNLQNKEDFYYIID